MNTKTLVLFAHPELENSRINASLLEAIKDLDNVTIRNLYEIYPDGKINVAEEQRIVESYPRILFQFPLYWYSSPSLLKKWFDLVVLRGWGYGSQGKALQGKQFSLAVSAGSKADEYTKNGKMGYTMSDLLSPLAASARFTKMIYKQPFLTMGSFTLSDSELEKQGQKYRRFLQNNW